MHRLPKQQDDGALASPRSSRAPSISSDRQSTTGSTSTIAAVYVPYSFHPPPAYVAVAAASQIVTDHQNATLLDELSPAEAENVPAESARFSDEALALLNGFLDSLLYSVLATGRSRSLTSIRPAVQEVLKPRLAREAIKAADEELSGLLADEEEDEELPQGQGEKWNLEAVFKRTRLRIMVYTRLGELEDEDEERFLDEDNSYAIAEDDAVKDAGLVSWAAAIFLTSVIEYIAEQTLIVAGQAAFNRVRGKRKKTGEYDANGQFNFEDLDRVIVQDFDMEKVALNSTLGRLWRTWKKSLRAPITPISASARSSFQRSASFGNGFYRRYSTGNAHDAPSAAALQDVPEVEHSECDIAANIPLPIGDNDIAEIEVPGLAKTYEDDALVTSTPEVQSAKKRPMSWLAAPGSGRQLLRTRSNSMPSLKQVAQRQASQASVETSDTPPFQTPAEYSHQREDYIAAGEQVAEANQMQGIEEEKDQFDEKDREDVSSVIAETGSLPGAASPPPAPAVRPRSMLRDRSPRPLQLGRDILANAKPTDTNRANRQPVENKVEILPKKPKSKSPPSEKENKENKSVKPSPSSEVIGLAKTSDVAKPAPPSPLPAEVDDAAQKEKKHARRLSASPPVARNNISPAESASSKVHPSKEDSSKAVPPKDEESRSSSTSSKQTPPSDLVHEKESETVVNNARASRAFRSQTVSTQASQTVPTGPPSVSALSSQTRDSSTSRKSHESSRSFTRNRAGTSEYGVDRATLQRVSSISSAGTSILHTSRGSESSIPTTTGNRRPTANSRKSEEDRTRDFDAAIAQADTVYYTLTPERMREVEREKKDRAAAEAQERSAHARSATATQVTVYPRVVHSGSGSPQMMQRSNSSSHGSMSSRQGKSTISDDAQKETKAQRPTPINQVGNIYTRNKYMPREPRVQTDPTFDLRDFLISTTPSSNTKSVAPIDTGFSRTADNASNASTPTGSKGFLVKSGSRSGKTSISEGSSSSPAPRGDSASRKPKKNFEPRSPAGPTHIDNDLIDLIRQGPPGSDHRIPRTVAPFRDTMDSDQMELYSNNVAPSVHSQTTTNSRSGLLSQSNTVHPAYSNEPSSLTGSMSDNGPMITKTRPKKRIDPYAIPDDDELEEEFGEHDDELTALPGSANGPLTNTVPPPSAFSGVTTSVTSTAPSATGNNTTASAPVPKPKPKTGTSDLADFLNSEPPGPTVSSGPVQPFMLSDSTLKAIKSGGSATAASANGIRSASNGSKASSLIGGGMGFPSSSTTTTTITAGNNRLGTSGSSGSFGSAKRSNTVRQTGARDARMDRSEERGGLSEMADFLKNSGPPPSMDEKPLPFIKFGKDGNPIDPGAVKEKSSGRGLRFWKR